MTERLMETWKSEHKIRADAEARIRTLEAQSAALIVQLRALRDDMQTIVIGPCAEQNPDLAQRIEDWTMKLDALLSGSRDKTNK